MCLQKICAQKLAVNAQKASSGGIYVNKLLNEPIYGENSHFLESSWVHVTQIFGNGGKGGIILRRSIETG